MEKNIILQWEARKSKLEDWFRSIEKPEYIEYIDIVKALFTYVIEGYNTSEIHVIDDGHCQGTQLLLIHKDVYQPSVEDYLITDTFYGTCSGCDTLMSICDCSNGFPNEKQIEQYMSLSLHLVQKLRRLNQLDNESDIE